MPNTPEAAHEPTAAEARVLALNAADQLGYLAPSQEWTNENEPLNAELQRAANHLAAAGRLPRFAQWFPTTTIRTPDTLKSVREALCAAQSALNHTAPQNSLAPHQVALLGRLITDIDHQRPLDPAGKHTGRGLCTDTCGCDHKTHTRHQPRSIHDRWTEASATPAAPAPTADQHAPVLRDQIAHAIAEADGRRGDLEPLADATYEQMADAALSVVAPLLEQLTAERDQARDIAALAADAAADANDAAQEARYNAERHRKRYIAFGAELAEYRAGRSRSAPAQEATRVLLDRIERVLQEWSDASEPRRAEIWQAMHEQADAVRDALDSRLAPARVAEEGLPGSGVGLGFSAERLPSTPACSAASTAS